MKSLELENFNLQALSFEDAQKTNGGILPVIAVAAFLVEFGCYAAAGDMILNFKSYSNRLRQKIDACK